MRSTLRGVADESGSSSSVGFHPPDPSDSLHSEEGSAETDELEAKGQRGWRKLNKPLLMIKIIVICRHSAGMRADFLLLLPCWCPERAQTWYTYSRHGQNFSNPLYFDAE